MLNFGFTMGKGSRACPMAEGEIFYNRNFDCGADGWETNSYGGVLTDNRDGTVTLTAEQNYSSITQFDKFPIPAGDYHMGVSISAITGKGKYSYKLADGTWTDAFTYDTAGTHQVDVTVGQEIIAIDIGADDDATAVITFDGVSCMDADIAHMPDWWRIGSLDSADILGVWDFASQIHNSQSDALTTLAGDMPNMLIDSGSPTWNGVDVGMNFGGSGSISSVLPDGLDMRDISCIIEFHSVTQNNASLDALYSHYYSDGNGHYTLQNAWNINQLRWSCGNDGSGTIEEGSLMTEGVICTAGRALYANGSLLGTVPDSDVTSSSGIKFTIGCIKAPNNTQYSKMKVKKLLLVKRVLTEAEQLEIYNNITGNNVVTYDSVPLTYEREEITYAK